MISLDLDEELRNISRETRFSEHNRFEDKTKNQESSLAQTFSLRTHYHQVSVRKQRKISSTTAPLSKEEAAQIIKAVTMLTSQDAETVDKSLTFLISLSKKDERVHFPFFCLYDCCCDYP